MGLAVPSCTSEKEVRFVKEFQVILKNRRKREWQQLLLRKFMRELTLIFS